MVSQNPIHAKTTTMRLMILRTLLLTLPFFLLLPASAGHKLIAEPAANDPMQVHVYQLDNGLTVYLSENPERPRFYAEFAVRCGSKHDPETATGLAHYLEHLMFKGSQRIGSRDWEKERPLLEKITALYEQHFKEADAEKRKEIYAEINKVSQAAGEQAIPNEFTKVITALGGNKLNAHCWLEETVYKVSMPSARLETWAKLEADRFKNPIFRLFHTELEIVYEEKNRAVDNNSRGISEAAGRELYRAHPYGQWTTLGKIEHLKKPSIELIKNQYRTYYVPNNMALCISGDIDIKKTIAVIDREFSVLERRELPKATTWKEPAFDGVRRVSVAFPGEEAVMLGWRTVPQRNPEEPACRLVDMMLANSSAGLIDLNLNQAQRVRSASSYPLILNDYGSQYLTGTPKEGQTLKEVEDLLLEQLDKLKAGEFEDWLLPAIITDYKLREQQKLEENTSRVELMRDSFIQYRPWSETVNEIATLESTTREQIIAAANKYFKRDNYVAAYRVDKERTVERVPKPEIEPLKISDTGTSDFAKELTSEPAGKIEPRFIEAGRDYQEFEAQNGTVILTATNDINDLFSMSIHIPFGTDASPELAIGDRLLAKAGTSKFSGEQLAMEWYKLGSSAALSVGRTESIITLSGIDDNFDVSLDLLLDWVQNPSVADDALGKMKTILKTSRANEQKNPQSVFRALLIYNRHGEHSSFLNRMPMAEIEKRSADQLLAPVKDLLNYPRSIHYTGPRSAGQVLSAFGARGMYSDKLKAAPKRDVIPFTKTDKTRIYLLDQDNAQALIRIEMADGKYNSDNTLPASLYREYFGGGMSSVVFQQLREARSLAYSAWSWYFEPPYPDEENIVAGFIGTQADKTCDALEAFLDLFENLPVSEDALGETLKSMESELRTDPVGFRGILSSVKGWKRLGMDQDPRRARFGELLDMGVEDLTAFHAEHIKGNPKLISIVGKKSEIDLERLGKIGEIIEIKTDKIFIK